MNAESNKPLYLQVEAAIRNAIITKKYSPGQKLPTEVELSELYEVSKITIRKAMEKLSNDGLVQRVQGKGTFVSYRKDKVTLDQTKGFNDSLASRGHTAKHKILNASYLKANEEIAQKLDLATGAPVIYIERLIWEDDIPVGIDCLYVSEKKFPDFITKLTPDKSLYQILENDYHIIVDKSMLEINGTIVDNERATLLECSVGDPLFFIEKISYTENGTPIHYSATTVRCDRITYVVTINKNIQMNEKIN